MPMESQVGMAVVGVGLAPAAVEAVEIESQTIVAEIGRASCRERV